MDLSNHWGISLQRIHAKSYFEGPTRVVFCIPFLNNNFSLNFFSKYTEQRTTPDMQVVYFVKADFLKNYQGNIHRVEKQVEEEFVNNLRANCFRERSHSKSNIFYPKNQSKFPSFSEETMMWRARTYGDAVMYEKAHQLRTPSCDKLAELYT